MYFMQRVTKQCNILLFFSNDPISGYDTIQQCLEAVEDQMVCKVETDRKNKIQFAINQSYDEAGILCCMGRNMCSEMLLMIYHSQKASKNTLAKAEFERMQNYSIVLALASHAAQCGGTIFHSGIGSCLGCIRIRYICVMLKLTKKSQSAVKFTHYRRWRVTFYLLILFDIFISPSSCIIHVVLGSV